MSVTFGFYNSVNHDRQYDAIQMSSIFDGIIKDGIFESIGDQLEVSANSGMVITVGSGRAWFNHTWTLNDALLPLTVTQAEVVLDRIDSVVLEVNADEMVRSNSIKLIDGTPSSTPVHPDLVDTEDVHQYRLADIAVGAGVTEITQAEITNYIGTTDTPFITGILETMNVDMLVAQWQSEYQQMKNADHIQYQSSLNADHTAYETQRQADDALFNAWFQNKMNEVIAWYNNLQVTIDQNVAVRLQNEIGTLSLLQTETKTNLVAAINELVGTSYPCFIRVNCAEEFAGDEITLSYGGSVKKTAIIPSTAPYTVEFAVKETGQYTIRETVYDISTTVNVTNYTIYNAGLYLGSISLTVDADFIGSVITCTDGSTTKTWVCDGLTHVFSVGLGTWTISGTVDGQTYDTSVTVTEYTQYNAELHTEVSFDYREWLESAGISPSGYSSLADVLADEAALRVLFTVHASVDYIADGVTGTVPDDVETIINNDYCAKWINAKNYALDTLYANASIAAVMDHSAEGRSIYTKVAPTSFVGFTGDAVHSDYPWTNLIDGNLTNFSSSQLSGKKEFGWGFDFGSEIAIRKVKIYTCNYDGYNFKIQYSDDHNTWTDATDNVLIGRSSSHLFDDLDVGSHRYWSIYTDSDGAAKYHRFAEVEFYAIQEDSSIHSKYFLGQWDYDATTFNWGPVGAVPTMTSNTTPEGECSGYEWQGDGGLHYVYLAFDGNSKTYHGGTEGIGGKTQYRFDKPVCVKRLYADVAWYAFIIQASNDDVNWDTLNNGTEYTTGGSTREKVTVDITNDHFYLYYRITKNKRTGTNQAARCYTLQFYGRQLDVSVPIMTSNTTPSGQAFASSYYNSDYLPFKAFNGAIRPTTSNACWISDQNSNLPQQLGYKFTKQTCLRYLRLYIYQATLRYVINKFVVQGSNNGTDWVDVSDTLTYNNAMEYQAYILDNDKDYLYYRINITERKQSGAGSQQIEVDELLFYGLDYSESVEYDIYSAAADTVFYYPGGDTSQSPVVLCTTDNTGHGKANISLAEGTSITLYSTVAKDTETGTGNYSKNISLVQSSNLYLMPDNALYWYGHFAKVSVPTINNTGGQNTNSIWLKGNGTSDSSAVFNTKISIPNNMELKAYIQFVGSPDDTEGIVSSDILNPGEYYLTILADYVQAGGAYWWAPYICLGTSVGTYDILYKKTINKDGIRATTIYNIFAIWYE